MRIILMLIFLLISFFSFGQNKFGESPYSEIPSKKYFKSLCLKYGSDTFSMGLHSIIRVSYKKKYYFEYRNEISALFDFKVYLIDNKFILKSYKDIADEGRKIEDYSFTPDKNINDIFLFPDSSVGIFIYNYNSPFHSGACGGCVEENFKLYRFSQNKIQIVFNFYTYLGNNGLIQLNDSIIFPKSSQCKIYNCINFKNDNDYWKTIKVEWNKAKTKLVFKFICFDDYNSEKNTETHIERARLVLTFLKKNNYYYFKAKCE